MIPDFCLRNNFPVVVSGYTVDSHLGDYYKRAAVRLQNSLLKLDLPHIIFPMKKADNWTHGCSFKPSLIKYVFDAFKRPVLWIDADGEVFSYPDIFENAKFDMALAHSGGHWLSGTLYFGMGGKDILDMWAKKVSKKEPDEITLLHMCRKHFNNRKIKMLEEKYNKVVHTKTDLSKVVIGHYIRPDVAVDRKVEPVKI